MGQAFETNRVKSIPVYDVNTTENTNEFKIVQLYINNTDEDICVVHRNNLPVVIRKSPGYFGGAGNFVIRTIYHFNSREQVVNTINNLQHLKKKSSMLDNDLEIVLSAMVAAYNSDHRITFYTVALDKEVSVKTLRNHSALYIHEADIMLCDTRATMKCLHPFSEEGMLHNDYRDLVEERRVTGVFLELIDNENNVKTRYMYAAKQLIEISAKQDKTKKSGLYFTLADHDRFGEVHIDPQYYTFDEAEKEVGLFKTREEAMTGGNPEVLSRTEEERAKTELTELRRQVELDKAAHDRERAAHEREKLENDRYRTETESELLEMNRQLEFQKNETRRLSEELDARKAIRSDYYEDRKSARADHYEEVSYRRKDDHELLKMAGVAVATGFTVYMAMNRNKSKKS